MEKKFKLLPPVMPNFISIEEPLRLQGDINQMSIPITDLTLEEAVQYGEMMKQTFILHYNKKKSKTP